MPEVPPPVKSRAGWSRRWVPCSRRSLGVRARGRDLFRAVERLDLEGVIAKRLADLYTPDTVWRKSVTLRTRRWRVGEISSNVRGQAQPTAVCTATAH